MYNGHILLRFAKECKMRRLNRSWLITIAGLVFILVLLIVSMVQYNNTKNDLEACEVERDGLSSQLSQAQSSLANLQTDYDALSAVFPPHDFASVAELQNWLGQNEVSELPPVNIFDTEGLYSKALKVQADAAEDGYIISVDIDVISSSLAYIACVAIIDGDFWWWDPETDELTLYNGLGEVTRD